MILLQEWRVTLACGVLAIAAGCGGEKAVPATALPLTQSVEAEDAIVIDVKACADYFSDYNAIADWVCDETWVCNVESRQLSVDRELMTFDMAYSREARAEVVEYIVTPQPGVVFGGGEFPGVWMSASQASQGASSILVQTLLAGRVQDSHHVDPSESFSSPAGRSTQYIGIQASLPWDDFRVRITGDALVSTVRAYEACVSIDGDELQVPLP